MDRNLVESVLEDGVVDGDEVTALRAEIFADGEVDRDEAEALFEINDGVSGADNDAGWTDLFVEGISSYVLDDDGSPGAVDGDEASWLLAQIDGDGQVDETELALLRNIRGRATSVAEPLNSRMVALGV